jgi:hypothetical protein
MNPVGLLLHASFRGLQSDDMATANIVLRDPRGRALWSDDRSLTASSRRRSSTFSSTSSVLVTLDVPRAGDYSIDYSLRASDPRIIDRTWLEVRRNRSGPSTPVLLAGGLAALASLGAGLFGSLRGFRSRARRAA